MVWKSSFWQNY